MDREIISNVVMTEGRTDAVFRCAPEEDVSFVLVSDLDLQARYSETILVFTKEKVVSYINGKITEYPYSEAETCFAKRCYGSAQFGFEKKDKTTEVISLFSYNHCAIFDDAASYVNACIKGENPQILLLGIKDATDKEKTTCPKCGRRLPRPGAGCTFCDNKGSLLLRIFAYAKPYIKPLAVGVVLSVLITVGALFPPYLTGLLVDTVLPEKNVTQLWVIVLVLLASYIVQYGLGMIRNYLLRIVSDKLDSDIRISIFEKAQHLPMSFFDKTSVGSVMNRIHGDSSVIYNFLINVSQNLIVQGCLGLGIIVIMLIMNPLLALLSLIPVPLVIFGTRLFGKIIRPYYNYIWRRQSALHSYLTDNLPGIRVVKAFTNEGKTADGYRKKNQSWMETDINSSKITIPFPVFIQFFTTCGSLLIWGVGGLNVIGGSVTTGLLVAFISYVSMFYGPVSFFANLNDTFQRTLTSTEKVFDILDSEPEPDKGVGQPLDPDKVQGRIEVRHVSFSFDNLKKTLNDINFVIEPGDVVGIVGTTGAGKSTIMNLLMRFYDNYTGDILFDGKNIRDIDLQSYRSIIGYVQQEPMMFHDTLYNNIAYGSGDDIDVERIIRSASAANAHDFISRMPDGYDTILGERGVGASGGERQRISIARAVYHDPKILFFDEATASVDSETEALIQSAIDRLVSGRTTIMIAHRLSTLKRANKIIVVDNGEILEMGSPDELIAQKGKFAKLIEIQTMSDTVRRQKEAERFD